MGSYMYRVEPNLHAGDTELKSLAMKPGDRKGLLGRKYIMRRNTPEKPRH